MRYLWKYYGSEVLRVVRNLYYYTTYVSIHLFCSVCMPLVCVPSWFDDHRQILSYIYIHCTYLIILKPHFFAPLPFTYTVKKKLQPVSTIRSKYLSCTSSSSFFHFLPLLGSLWLSVFSSISVIVSFLFLSTVTTKPRFHLIVGYCCIVLLY